MSISRLDTGVSGGQPQTMCPADPSSGSEEGDEDLIDDVDEVPAGGGFALDTSAEYGGQVFDEEWGCINRGDLASIDAAAQQLGQDRSDRGVETVVDLATQVGVDRWVAGE